MSAHYDDTPMLEPTTIYIFISILLFLFGTSTAYVLLGNNKTPTSSTKLRAVIAIAVTLVWMVSIAAEIIIPAYTVSVLIHGIMGAVVGYLFSKDGLNINIGGE